MDMAVEHTLLAEAQASAEGFGRLYDATYDRIYAYAYRRTGSATEAEDITAAVFEAALRGIGRVRLGDRPVLAWLYGIARYHVADHYRRRGVTAEDNVETDGREGESPDPQERLEGEEQAALLRRALASLSADDQAVLDSVYFAGLPRDEAARLMGISTNALYVRLHRALARLRRQVTALEQGHLPSRPVVRRQSDARDRGLAR